MQSNELTSGKAAPSRNLLARKLYGASDRAIFKLFGGTLSRAKSGRVLLTLPSGREAVFGGNDRDATARLVLNNYRVFAQLMRRGSLGFAESYMAGDVDTDNLYKLFSFYMENERALLGAGDRFFRSGHSDRTYHSQRVNTRLGSRRNIAEHYDLGNAFYRLWLDEGMTYSSGIFASPATSLADAQRAKYDCILDALDLQPGQSVLEIGCGWGGFAEAASKRGAAVTGLTISQQQFDESTARMQRAGAADAVEIRLQDYRDVTGQFDHIASIEMIEAVGEDHWPVYFDTLAKRLKPGGSAVVQAITLDPALFDNYRRHPDFIQRYIFPGGMLLTDPAMHANAAAAGLTCETVKTFGSSYVLTLTEWQRRFDAAWPHIAALGFDDRFRRMWNYYFSYCRVGFERGTIDVGVYRMRKSM